MYYPLFPFRYLNLFLALDSMYNPYFFALAPQNSYTKSCFTEENYLRHNIYSMQRPSHKYALRVYLLLCSYDSCKVLWNKKAFLRFFQVWSLASMYV